MRTKGILTVFAGLLLAACSGDYCDRRAEVAESCGQEFTSDEADACDDALKECSRSDRRLLDEYADCLEEAGLLACEGVEGESSLEDYMTCATPLLDVSDACFDAMAAS